MTKNMSNWGKDKAQERYGKADGGRLPEHPSPPIQPKEWPPHPLDRKASGGKVKK